MIFDWDPEKEKWLKENRGVSFLHVLFHIENDDLLDVREHPNKEKHPHQKVLILKMSDYVYIVPFIQGQDSMFLKTIIPSRKETKRYLK
jgi:uncharacterized DUF497 family protein